MARTKIPKREYRSKELNETIVIERRMPATVEITVYPDRGPLRWHQRMPKSDCAALLRACGFRRVH